ncbi:MAG: serine/threonine-protein kinase [Kofleriaceae bacterium]
MARSPDLESGTAIGDYRIESTIGSGGMATVYAAVQPVIGKRVAIKVLHQAKSETAINRFIKEARAVNLIGHPNIVDVFGFGMTDRGRPYLVMELLEGETLAVRAARDPLDVSELCDMLTEVAYALEAAHEVGIIHRDLKPENIFISRRRHITHVKLLDFGIAKYFGTESPAIGEVDDTRPGVLIGTPRYISPEQVRGTKLDGRVDVYALGVVAFELLTGRPPFTANNSYDLFQKHAKLKPPVPSSFEPKVPPAMDTLIAQMLAKDPADRPTLVDVRAQLDKLRDHTDMLPIVSSRPSTTAVNVIPASTPQPTDVRTTPHERPLGVWQRIAIAFVAAAVGGILVSIVTHRNRHTIVQAPPPPAPVVKKAAPVVDQEAIEIDPVVKHN